ncbi:MAG: hypothetical protein LBO09_05655 [Candidatus Peribacteria bacterium]|nr:hypothetical protein [Candidatus Peribacteria bacterium]
MTLVLLKDENYEANIASLGENYNLFALRGHCYNTDQMAYVLGKQNKVEQNDILIDGGCWNANKLGKYTKVGIQGLMFAYTDTGKGASTEHCIDKIFELKAK